MKIDISNDEKILKLITLTDIQYKSLQLMGDPVEIMEKAINGHLDYQMNQAKQKYALYKVATLSDIELDEFLNDVAVVEEEKKLEA